MKALSVRNPWANDILCGLKKFEYRSWKTDFRGDFVICSTANPKIKDTLCGYALCVVRLKDVHLITLRNYKQFDLDECPDGLWYAWELSDIRVIKPFPVKGKLNFFDVPDEKIEIVSEDMSEEEAQKFCDEYIVPFLYKGRR